MKLTLCSDLFTVSICFFVCKLAFIYLQCLRNVQVGYGLVVRIGFPIQGLGLDKDQIPYPGVAGLKRTNESNNEVLFLLSKFDRMSTKTSWDLTVSSQ